MKVNPHDSLLAVMTADEEVFRSVMLRQTLTLARRRRSLRLARRALATVGVVALAGVVSLHQPAKIAPTSAPQVAAAPSVRIVHSIPLAANECVHTRDGLFKSVESTSGGLSVITSRNNAVALIETNTVAPAVEFLDDQRLLGAFSHEHAAIIAAGTKQARLVFF
jgi:hypothetical protein